MDKFLTQYLVTALWSSIGEDNEPLDKKFGIEDIDQSAIDRAKKDCEAFKEAAGDFLDEYDEGTCGHDFWLTRNGHGAGFWDGDYGDIDGEELTIISNTFPGIDLYEGDDGKLYFM